MSKEEGSPCATMAVGSVGNIYVSFTWKETFECGKRRVKVERDL